MLIRICAFQLVISVIDGGGLIGGGTLAINVTPISLVNFSEDYGCIDLSESIADLDGDSDSDGSDLFQYIQNYYTH